MRDTVSVVIVNWNGKELLKTCLPSVIGSDYGNLEVIVVDCVSADGSVDFLRTEYPSVKVILLKEDKGFSFALNVGCNQASGGYILMLNNDVILEKSAISKLVSQLKQEEGSIFIPTEFDWAGIFVHNGAPHLWIGRPLYSLIRLKGEEPFYSGVACTLLTKTLFLQNPVNDRFFLYEDVEWGWRLQLKNVKTKVVDTAYFFHKRHASISNKKTAYFEGRNIIATHFICLKTSTFLLFSPFLIYYNFKSVARYSFYKRIDCGIAFLKGFKDFLFQVRNFNVDRQKVQRERLRKETDIIKSMIRSWDYEIRCKLKYKNIFVSPPELELRKK